MPPVTYDAFREHGKAVVTITDNLKDAHELLGNLKKIGIDMTTVTDELTVAGVKSFSDSYNNLLVVIERRRHEVAHV
jgi:transaldolase/glucose-6-phosphate isomerase